MSQSKACKCNDFQYYAITNKYVTSEWPVQFLEEALNNMGTRKGLISSPSFRCLKINQFLVQFSAHRREQKAFYLNKKVSFLKSRFPFGVPEHSCLSQFMSAQSGTSPPHLG